MQSRDKKCGILLAVSSLPSDYGIGSFDKAAYEFIDLLKECRQDYWQILPLCPVGKGNSPYYSPASFAGEILYIDISKLKNDRLISYIPDCTFTKNVDYKKVRNFKLPLIKEAANNFDKNTAEYKEFCKIQDYWLNDYAIFMTLKDIYGSVTFYDWENDAKRKKDEFIADIISKHEETIDFYKVSQFFFYSQYSELKAYANKNGIKIIGDIPFYVSPDSSDVWANPECFELNEDFSPRLVAGVPPDIFSADGQLWGNPIYDWDYQRKNDYNWWQKRLKHNSKLYDIVRIDHFRAFCDYYAIPSAALSAKEGCWVTGEGMNFWNKIRENIGDISIIAEDLGGETDEVKALVKESGFPNMKLLQFAFDSDLSDPFLPENYNSNCVCYTGTHDNDTTLGWYNKLPIDEKKLFHKMTAESMESSPVLRLIEYGMKSVADTVIIPFQDYLQIDSSARLNTPGTSTDNWSWRYEQKDITEETKESIIRLSDLR